jgi:hypothetical protein
MSAKVDYVGAREIEGKPFVAFHLTVDGGLGIDVVLPANEADAFAVQVLVASARAKEDEGV